MNKKFTYDISSKAGRRADFPAQTKDLGATLGDFVKDILTYTPSAKTESWAFFDKVVGGLRQNEFTVFCGPTGVGKTEWLANLALLLGKNNNKVFVASVETGPVDFFRRMASIYLGEDLNEYDTIPKEKLQQILKKIHPFFDQFKENIKFAQHQNRVPLVQLISDLENACNMGCSVAILDNLNFFMEITSAQNAIIEMDHIIHELIIFCKNHPIHIIMVMHPRKTDGGRVESEFDIKGSSTAVQEAQNVLLFNRPTEEWIKQNINEKKINPIFWRELKIAKMRRKGKFCGSTITYQNDGGRYREGTFTNRATGKAEIAGGRSNQMESRSAPQSD